MDALTKACAWLFPQYCQLCAQPLNAGQQVCAHCISAFTGINGALQENLLMRADIQRQFPLRYIDGLQALDWYRPPLSTWLKQYKYQQRMYRQVALSSLLTHHFARLANQPDWHWPQLVAPIPLAPSRLIWRGFNQVVRLWQDALPQQLFAANLLRRRHSTRTQARLGARQRRKNLTNAFSVHANVHNLDIALVDDVLTTGATLDSAAKLLKAAGARSVSAWVVCLTAKT
ncbi:ComF family protein [Pseudoalteromonas sp. T1lg48]|uniref:ComF family protein n=1 Tax=Pseudoalteromonas sp. T1lg48 TaxID=2077100 RepID=UPI000CF6F287|nr:phosphoribosyltransferase family protein [Pseudoalteromonas sp. T1lg48]